MGALLESYEITRAAIIGLNASPETCGFAASPDSAGVPDRRIGNATADVWIAAVVQRGAQAVGLQGFGPAGRVQRGAQGSGLPGFGPRTTRVQANGLRTSVACHSRFASDLVATTRPCPVLGFSASNALAITVQP